MLALGFALSTHVIHTFLHLFDAFLHFGLVCLMLLIHLLATFLLLAQELLTRQAATACIAGKTARHARRIRTGPTFHPFIWTELRRRCSRRRTG